MYGHYHDPDQKERTWKEKEAYGAYRVYTEKNIENLPWKIGEERKTRIFQLWRRIDVPLIFIIKAISISLQSQKYYSYEWEFSPYFPPSLHMKQSSNSKNWRLGPSFCHQTNFLVRKHEYYHPLCLDALDPPHLSMWEMQPTHNVDSVEWYQGPGQNWDRFCGNLAEDECNQASSHLHHISSTLNCATYDTPRRHRFWWDDSCLDTICVAFVIIWKDWVERVWKAHRNLNFEILAQSH
jgi:hypothetical protein